jgi:transcription initiation factor TFIIH subunit 2
LPTGIHSHYIRHRPQL